jgi:mRNA interferase YafQ
MYEAVFTNAFKADLKRAKKRGCNLSLLSEIMDKLINKIPLEERYRDHELTGNYAGTRECHIKPDWLLIYYYEGKAIVFERTGSHSDLFR